MLRGWLLFDWFDPFYPISSDECSCQQMPNSSSTQQVFRNVIAVSISLPIISTSHQTFTHWKFHPSALISASNLSLTQRLITRSLIPQTRCKKIRNRWWNRSACGIFLLNYLHCLSRLKKEKIRPFSRRTFSIHYVLYSEQSIRFKQFLWCRKGGARDEWHNTRSTRVSTEAYLRWPLILFNRFCKALSANSSTFFWIKN